MARKTFTPAEAEFIGQERVLRFNSSSGGGDIHSVPICFAFDGTNFYAHARKPDAKRWRNVKGNPSVSLELDSYSDDWSQLKGVLVHGKAEFLDSGPDHDLGLRLLKEKYHQYREGASALSSGVPVVRVVPTRVTNWYLGGSAVSRPGPR